MHALGAMARICVHDSPTERLRMLTSAMDMLELPSIFNWSNLPDRFFFTVKDTAPQKANRTFSES